MGEYKTKWLGNSSNQLLILITLLGFILRIIRLTYSGIWLDETYTVYFARLPIHDLIQSELHGEMHNPPLYYLFMHYWIKLFGESPFSLRFPPALISTLTIPFFYFALNRLGTPKYIGLTTILLLSLSPAHIYYAHEARSYSLMLFWMIGSLYFLGGWLKNSHIRDSIGLVSFSILGFYTSIFSILWMAAIFLYMLIYITRLNRSVNKELFKKWLNLVILTLFPIIPYLLYMLYVPGAMGVSGNIQYSVSMQGIMESWIKLASGVWIPIPQLSRYLAGPILIFGIGISIYKFVSKKYKTEENIIQLGIILLFFPYISLVILSLIKPMFIFDRYGIICLPGFILLSGTGLAIFIENRKKMIIGMVLFILLLVGWSQSIRVTYRQPKVHLSDVYQYIENQSDSNIVIGITPGYWQVNYDYYDRTNRKRFQLNSPKDVETIREIQKFWLITIPYTPPNQEVIQYLNQEYPYQKTIKIFPPHFIEIREYMK